MLVEKTIRLYLYIAYVGNKEELKTHKKPNCNQQIQYAVAITPELVNDILQIWHYQLSVWHYLATASTAASNRIRRQLCPAAPRQLQQIANDRLANAISFVRIH